MSWDLLIEYGCSIQVRSYTRTERLIVDGVKPPPCAKHLVGGALLLKEFRVDADAVNVLLEATELFLIDAEAFFYKKRGFWRELG